MHTHMHAHRLPIAYKHHMIVTVIYLIHIHMLHTTHQAVRERGNTNTSVGEEITLVCAHACTYVRV